MSPVIFLEMLTHVLSHLLSYSGGNIECGQVMTGSLNDSDEASFTFENNLPQDVTFTNCDSDFDTKLYLIDSAGNYIQNQSTNNCGGDDCSDATFHCSRNRAETFTMEQLAVGTYTILLTPYDGGGNYSLEVHCTANTGCFLNLLCGWHVELETCELK